MRRLLLALLFVLPAVASAEILVRDCPNNVCVWTLPANATRVQVNRTGTPIVSLADVLPTERIVTCYHDPDLVPGASGSCDTRVPGRTDVWELKSVLYPTASPGGSLEISVDASNPRWDSQAPLSSNLLPSLYVRLYGGRQGESKTLVDAAPWANSLRFRRESGSVEMFCFAASLALDTTGDQIPDLESDQTAEWCGTHQSPAPVLRLAPPNGITGQAPAP
jgi:hypothetical protein